jgi:hypothetical protein
VSAREVRPPGAPRPSMSSPVRCLASDRDT